MPEHVYLAFDFGMKRIGVAIGQQLTQTARPLSTIKAMDGVPSWPVIETLIQQWKPYGLVVGIPTCLDGKELYVTPRAKSFAKKLKNKYELPVYLADERLSTVEARSELFEQGGYRRLKKTEIDSIAACVILEQWLSEQ